MQYLTLDFETYYDEECSLRRMTPVQYLTHPRFHVHGASFRSDSLNPTPDVDPLAPKAQWLWADRLPEFFAKVDWSQTILISHNAGFDGAVLAWHYGCTPCLYVDTMGIARATVYAYTGSAALDAVAAHLGLAPKGTALARMKGLTTEAIRADAALAKEFEAYGVNDSDICFGIFHLLKNQMTPTEFRVMDMVVRMTVKPQLTLNLDVLRTHYHNVVADKEKLLAFLSTPEAREVIGIDIEKGVLLSNEKFARALARVGVEVPMKWSPKQCTYVPAFAKTDEGFRALLEHSNGYVQALAAARIGVKSTIEETRTARFIAIGETKWPAPAYKGSPVPPGQPLMPFPLRYSGAHTHRLSGDWSLNMQNLGRTSPLRASLEAPPGHVVIAPDASQIEARIVAWVAGANKLLDAFRFKRDPYCELASVIYNRPITKADAFERFVGKTGVLGLGYGMGAQRFVIACANQGKVISPELAQRAVTAYRTEYYQVKEFWAACGRVLHAMVKREAQPFREIFHVNVDQSITLPNGMRLFYNDLQIVRDDAGQENFVYRYGREWKKIFGGMLTENLVQALARIVVMDAAVRVRYDRKVPYYPAGQAHDQLIYVVPESEAEAILALVIEEMSRPPWWAPDLPLAAEGKPGRNFLEAK
jgi:DNA polymerase